MAPGPMNAPSIGRAERVTSGKWQVAREGQASPPAQSVCCPTPAQLMPPPRPLLCCAIWGCQSTPPPERGCWRAAIRKAVSVESRRSEEHTSELQSRLHLVCRLLLEKK